MIFSLAAFSIYIFIKLWLQPLNESVYSHSIVEGGFDEMS